jgi:hypothetical protein
MRNWQIPEFYVELQCTQTVTMWKNFELWTSHASCSAGCGLHSISWTSSSSVIFLSVVEQCCSFSSLRPRKRNAHESERQNCGLTQWWKVTFEFEAAMWNQSPLKWLSTKLQRLEKLTSSKYGAVTAIEMKPRLFQKTVKNGNLGRFIFLPVTFYTRMDQ